MKTSKRPGGRNRQFFHSLTPLANAIRSKCTAPAAPQLSLREQANIGMKEEAMALEKRSAKLARRAARAGYKGSTK